MLCHAGFNSFFVSVRCGLPVYDDDGALCDGRTRLAQRNIMAPNVMQLGHRGSVKSIVLCFSFEHSVILHSATSIRFGTSTAFDLLVCLSSRSIDRL